MRNWNKNKIKIISVKYKHRKIHLYLDEYICCDEIEELKEKYDFHLIKAQFYSSPFNNVNNRKQKYKNQYSRGIHEGYILDVEFKDKLIVNAIYLKIDNYNFTKTENLIDDSKKNKEEIEFIKKYIISQL